MKMKQSTLLKKVLRQFQRGTNPSEYICTSLSQMASLNMLSRGNAEQALRHWIYDQLGGRVSYPAWLCYNHGKVWNWMRDDELKEGRIQWMKCMIQYLEKEGK